MAVASPEMGNLISEVQRCAQLAERSKDETPGHTVADDAFRALIRATFALHARVAALERVASTAQSFVDFDPNLDDVGDRQRLKWISEALAALDGAGTE